jgi:hypothetical protein
LPRAQAEQAVWPVILTAEPLSQSAHDVWPNEGLDVEARQPSHV